ncbi:hypothetical protein B0H11DRAFT_2183176 [Mycena galericulata]|nr:hypothetical protein B0H11DRAFT_2183176 [Mycena galericulata]
MPSRAHRDAAEQNHILLQKLKKAEAKIEKLERREVARQAGKPANLIPKASPEDAMELSDDSEHYCRLYRIVKDVVHQFLPVTKTISQQDKTRVDATIVKIAKLAPYFARFAGYWPAHDMIRTYLLNMQTRRNKDLELEKKWMEGELGENDEAEGADAGTETLEMDGEDLEMDDMEEEEDEANDFADYSPPGALKKRKVSFRVESDDDDEAEGILGKKNDAKQAVGHYIELGKQNQWPQIIDYNTVPARILKLKDSLLKMIQDPDVLQTSFIWNDFISRIGSQIFKFASSASKLAFTDALYGRRCGYYGPKGEFLINSTLLRILSTDEDALSYKLYDTLSSIIDEAPDSFDEYDDTSNLIALKDFVAFILTPFTAALLIAEDRNISLEEATDVQDASNNFGDMMQPDDDDLTIEDLHRKNIRATGNANNPFFSQPPRYRKPAFLGLQIETKPLEIESQQEVNSKSQLKESKPKPKGTGKTKAKPKGLLSLDDFLEPAPKPKNTNGNNKPAGKAKVPKRNPSQDNNVSTAGGYGTRSKSKMKSESE